jgi:hypothetical protein
MKINRFFYLLAPSLLICLICFIRADCVSIAAQTDPPIQTDKKIYSITLRPHGPRVVIKWIYTNRTGATVYQARSAIDLSLEEKIGDKWVVAWGRPRSPSPEEFVSINPGGTCRGIWTIGHNIMKDVPGAYRIVIDLYGTEDGEMLPLEERVSNEFEVVEKE